MGRRYPDALERIQRVMVRPVTGGGAYRSYFLDAPAMALFLKWRGEPMERMSIYTVEGPFDRGGGKRADLFVNPLGFELLATEGEDDPKVA